MKITLFQGKSNLEAYLEWEKKMKLIFDGHNYLESKKVKLIVIEFMYYVLCHYMMGSTYVELYKESWKACWDLGGDEVYYEEMVYP